MICSKCGKQCADSAKICPSCGNELIEAATEIIGNDQGAVTPSNKSFEQPDETKFTLWNSDDTDVTQPQSTEVQTVGPPVEPQMTDYGDKPAGFVTNFDNQPGGAAEPVLPVQPVRRPAPQAQQPKPKKKKKADKGKLVAAIIAVLLVAVAVVAAMFLLKDGKKDDSVQSDLKLGNKYLGSYNY